MSSSLPAFFADLAENWRGWQGPRAWGSLEDELRIEATHDRVGHVNVRIRMQAYVGTPQQWSITGNLVLEPGALEALAREAERFFQSGGWGWK